MKELIISIIIALYAVRLIDKAYLYLVMLYNRMTNAMKQRRISGRRLWPFMLLLMLIPITSNAQLNEVASNVKDKAPELYAAIKCHAVSIWIDDHDMIVHTINKQCIAVFKIRELMDAPNYDESILGGCLVKWRVEGDCKDAVDYDMVVYEYEKQLKAKSEY